MSCETVVPLLSPFLDGELDPREEDSVRAHLAGCGRCAGRLESLRAVRSAVRATRPERSGDGLDSLRARLRQAPPVPDRRSRGLWTGLAAGLALLAAGSIWVSRGWQRPDHGPSRETTPAPAAVAGSVREIPDAGSSTPCAEARECGEDAREIWPALDI